MNMLKPCLPLACAVLLLGCRTQQEREPYAAEAESAAETSTDTIAAAQDAFTDTSRQFVRTAELTFKVADVAGSTSAIESITRNQGGFIIHTALNATPEYSTTTQVRKDSALTTSCYSVTNDITLRVPNSLLDTTLTLIAQTANHLDHREVTADDVSLRLLAQSMEQTRAANNTAQLKNIATYAQNKLRTDIAVTTTQNQQQHDEAMIAHMGLADNVRYSTVHIQLYQQQIIEHTMVAIAATPAIYQPSLFARATDALRDGWLLLEYIFIGILHIWGILLLAATAFFTFRQYKSRYKKSAPVA